MLPLDIGNWRVQSSGADPLVRARPPGRARLRAANGPGGPPSADFQRIGIPPQGPSEPRPQGSGICGLASGRASARHKIAALAVAAVLLSACGKDKEKEAADAEGPATVMVETAVLGAIDHVINADAVLYPVNQANVTSKISAPVKRVLVNRGDHVRAGQILVELESADLAAAANESKNLYEQSQAAYQTLTRATVFEDKTKAQSDVQAAQQTYDAAKRVYDSRVALQKQGALAQKLVEDAKVAMVQAQSQLETAKRHLEALDQVSQREAIRGAEAQMNAAKAHYENAAVQVAYAEVRSPISGVVADRPVYPGEMPAAGSPLVSIVDISKVVARANVPVKEAASLKPGRPARISGPDGDLPGVVTVVSPAVDPSTTTVEVWIRADNPGERLKPGGTVHAAIIAETVQNTIVVPAAALLNSDDGGQKVMVVTSDNVAHERSIAAGFRQGDRVQIVSGLQNGDQVVVQGGLGLEDKAKVKIEQPKPEESDENADEPDAAKDQDGAKDKAPDKAKPDDKKK